MSPSRRVILGAGSATLFGQAARAAPGFDVVVGQGGDASVAAAVARAPGDRPFRILVRNGVWREKLTVDKAQVHLVGESRTGAIIRFGDTASAKGPDGRPMGTTRTASLNIAAPDCSLRRLTIDNDFDYLAARRADPANVDGNGLQAIALTISGTADRTLVEDADITGWQDTLFPNAGVSLFRDCRITGFYDFIFGAGTALFERCTVFSRPGPDVTLPRQGYLTAPSTPISRAYGLVFSRCRLEADPAVKPGVIALGRPWRASNPQAQGECVYLNCWMGAHIDPTGWDRMPYGKGASGETLWFNPDQARFFEFHSTGPGAATTPARRQLTTDQARFFARDRVLGEWKE